MRYAMAIDTRKCVGCSDCVVACQTENNVPIGYCRDWITETVDGSYPNVEIELRTERCNHCDNPPCVRCCPTGASHVHDWGGMIAMACAVRQPERIGRIVLMNTAAFPMPAAGSRPSFFRSSSSFQASMGERLLTSTARRRSAISSPLASNMLIW